MIVPFLLACFGAPRFGEADIADTLADAYCERLKECARGEYEAIYFGRADCERQNAVVYDALVASFDDCDYDEAEAEEAWIRLGELSCGDFHDGAYVADYAEIWTGCPAGGGPGGGPTDTGGSGG